MRGAGDRYNRRRRQGGWPGFFRACARDLRADGRGGRRLAEIAGLRAAAALGAGGMLVGGGCRTAGARGGEGAAGDADDIARHSGTRVFAWTRNPASSTALDSGFTRFASAP